MANPVGGGGPPDRERVGGMDLDAGEGAARPAAAADDARLALGRGLQERLARIRVERARVIGERDQAQAAIRQIIAEGRAVPIENEEGRVAAQGRLTEQSMRVNALVQELENLAQNERQIQDNLDRLGIVIEIE